MSLKNLEYKGRNYQYGDITINGNVRQALVRKPLPGKNILVMTYSSIGGIEWYKHFPHVGNDSQYQLVVDAQVYPCIKIDTIKFGTQVDFKTAAKTFWVDYHPDVSYRFGIVTRNINCLFIHQPFKPSVGFYVRLSLTDSGKTPVWFETNDASDLSIVINQHEIPIETYYSASDFIQSDRVPINPLILALRESGIAEVLVGSIKKQLTPIQSQLVVLIQELLTKAEV